MKVVLLANDLHCINKEDLKGVYLYSMYCINKEDLKGVYLYSMLRWFLDIQ